MTREELLEKYRYPRKDLCKPKMAEFFRFSQEKYGRGSDHRD